MTMRVTPIECLADNYAYLLTCEASGDSVVIDPSESEPVLAAIARDKARVVAIWNTHHHYDHVGGNEEVLAKTGAKEIVAHASDKGRVPGQTRFIEEGDELSVGKVRVSVLHIPGHTTGAIAYVATAPDGGPSAVFTGDMLFLAGCGRIFEGTPAMMHTSLSKVAALAPDTLVYCGHEYTASNLKFAAHVEPDNAQVTARAERIAALRAAKKPTVPGVLRDELATNPFLRVDSTTIRKTLGIAPDASNADALGVIRKAKDSF
jgi:hydroxyacylglutathione hydrolase